MTSLSASCGKLARKSASRLLRTRVAAALCEPRGVDHYAALVAPTWSASETRARIVGLHRETSDTVSLLLEPNGNWRGFRAGQHVPFTATIGGVRHTRTYSISSSPRSGVPLRITVRAQPGGRVSSWASDTARRGNIVVLGAASGDFVVPETPPASLLLVSGGSGITPIMSMVRELLYSGYAGTITHLHFARSELIFRDELELLTEEFANFRFFPQLTAAGGSPQHFSRTLLESVSPEWHASEAYVCGPASLERSVTALWDEQGLRERVHVERFVPSVDDLPPLEDVDCDAAHTVVCSRSSVSLHVDGRASLLARAEAAGLSPAYGCRMGICHTCERTKERGVVRDLRTGERSGAGREKIRLCVSAPVSDVTLDL